MLADSMLGRLAKWLRLLGYDTLYASTMTDHQIAARARAEGRVVLTRDRELARRKGVRCLFVHSDVSEDQIGEIVAALGKPPNAQPRCPRCNTPLVQVSPDHARPYVPGHVFKAHRHFRYCPDCTRHYWPGSHWKNIQSIIGKYSAKEAKGKD